MTVRDWLKSHKRYSLNASHGPGGSVAAQFVFDMKKGYCQYFATSMAVMLRTQGVPARYVVGFAGGRRVGAGKYLVTSDRGHAWVEVYFPHTGWVRFDPTASGSLPVSSPQPPYNVSLNRSAVAGAPVTVSVRKNGTAVVGAPVFVNGSRVGWTDGSGTVSTVLPYASTVTVTARPPGAASRPADGGQSSPPAGTAALGAPPGGSSRLYSVTEPGTPPQPASENATSRTYRSDTNATVAVRGTPHPGATVSVTARVGDVPVRNATVAFDGRPVGRTNDHGTYTLSLANVSPGTHRVGVRRGAIDAITSFTVGSGRSEAPAGLSVTASAPLGFPLPGGPATVRVTRDGAPVPNASVATARGRLGRTDANGTLAVSLPINRRVTVRASAGGRLATTADTGLYRDAALLLGGLLVLLAAAALFLGRRGYTARGVARSLRAVVRRAAAVALDLLFRVTDGLLAAGAAVRRGARRALAWLATLPARLAERGLDAFAALHPRRLLATLRGFLAGLRADDEADEADATDGDAARAARSGAEDAPGAPGALRDLWRSFVSLLAPPGLRTMTPAEVAAYAVSRGLPAGAVESLTDIYRDAEYGRTPADDSRLDRARDALAAIRDANEEGD